MEKIKFNDLSLGIKISIIISYAIGFIWLIAFGIGFIIGLKG